MSGNTLRELENLALESHADAIAAEARSLAERAKDVPSGRGH